MSHSNTDYSTDSLFRVALDAAPTGMLLVDSDGIIRLVNMKTLELFGYRESELIDHPLEILVPDKYRSMHQQHVERYTEHPVKRPMGGRQAHLLGRRKDGSEFPVEIALNPVRSETSTHVLASIIDQSEIVKTRGQLFEYEILRERQSRNLALFQQISMHANGSLLPEDAMLRCLEDIGRHMNWDFGHIYLVSETPETGTQLVPSKFFYTTRPGKYRSFEKTTRNTVFQPGVGLPGIIYESGRALWVESVKESSLFHRTEAARENDFHAALGFPVMLHHKVVAVFEFYSSEMHAPDDDTLELLSYISQQLAQIFERKIANREISSALKRIHSHISNTPVVVIEMDPEMKIIQWNKTAETIFGWTKEEVLGKTPVEIGMSVDTDNEVFRERLVDAAEVTKTYSSDEKRLSRTKSGEVVRAQWFNTLLRNENDQLESVISFALDRRVEYEMQRQLQESEERFKLAVAAIRAGIYDWDIEAGEIWFSGRLIEKLGVHKSVDNRYPESLIYEFTHPDDLELVRSSGMQMQKEAGELKTEFRQINPETGYFWIEENALSVANDEGKVVRVVGTFTDITARKNAEEALKKYADDLRRSNAELEQFAYVASHDLQEPLRMVASFTELLAKRYNDQLDEKGREYIDYAVDGAKRMQHLINDLLAYSRINRDTSPFSIVDMNDVVRDAQDNLMVLINEKSASISSSRLPKVNGDPYQLVQLIQNLLANAMKYARSDVEPVIDIEVEGNYRLYTFSVRDNGIGIAPAYFEKIFVIFRRLHNAAEYSGTGIGLSICKAIVERHDGRIWAEPNEPHGVVFKFTLPAA